MKLLEHSTYEYIMFCDQHDIWLPNKLEIHIGGSLLNESITQPTNTGGIKSRILFEILEKHDHENNFQ